MIKDTINESMESCIRCPVFYFNSRVTAQLINSILNNEQRKSRGKQEIDVGYEKDTHRFRINVYHSRNTIGASMRLIPASIQTIEQLLPPVSIPYRV